MYKDVAMTSGYVLKVNIVLTRIKKTYLGDSHFEIWQTDLIYICKWILLVLNLIYVLISYYVYFGIINLCTQLAVTAISHKIANNCCHFEFWRPYLISKTCFLRFYYLLQSHLLPCNVLCFVKKVYWFYSVSIRIKMRFWGPFWIAIIIFSPRMPKWHSADSY